MGTKQQHSNISKKIKSSIRKVVILICIIIFVYSLYNIIVILKGYKRNDDIMSDVQKLYYERQGINDKPEQNSNFDKQISGKKELREKFDALVRINPDVVGWINVPNTRIDYPVLQAADNEYYLDMTINKEHNSAGSIFMDYRNSNNVSSNRHTILYGHHMRNGSMFKDLVKYEDKDFFLKNNIIKFDTLYEEIEWEVFSVYLTDTNFDYIKVDFQSSEEYIEYINSLKDKSMFNKDIEFTGDAQILTLSTCAYDFDDARLVVHAFRSGN